MFQSGRRRLLILVAVVLSIPGSGSADQVDDYVREQMRVRNIPGLVVMVLKSRGA
jgi:hypothetical protein